jgi:hypothetical protein
MNTLLREKILTPQPGRCSVGPSGAKVGVRETVDMFDIGSEKVMYGGVVEAILASRQRRPVAPYVPDVDQDRWIEELELAVNEWNTEVAVQRDDGLETDVDGIMAMTTTSVVPSLSMILVQAVNLKVE